MLVRSARHLLRVGLFATIYRFFYCVRIFVMDCVAMLLVVVVRNVAFNNCKHDNSKTFESHNCMDVVYIVLYAKYTILLLPQGRNSVFHMSRFPTSSHVGFVN